MPRLKKKLLTLCILTTGIAVGAWGLGFHAYPAGIETEPGYVQRHDADFMNRCGKARITSAVRAPDGLYDLSLIHI